jgi:hypothetical protein
MGASKPHNPKHFNACLPDRQGLPIPFASLKPRKNKKNKKNTPRGVLNVMINYLYQQLYQTVPS